jgi:hypothetical protein
VTVTVTCPVHLRRTPHRGSLRVRAMPATLRQAMCRAKICRTTGTVARSASRRCLRLPHRRASCSGAARRRRAGTRRAGVRPGTSFSQSQGVHRCGGSDAAALDFRLQAESQLPQQITRAGDQFFGDQSLPLTRYLRVMSLHNGHPPVEREPDHTSSSAAQAAKPSRALAVCLSRLGLKFVHGITVVKALRRFTYPSQIWTLRLY